MTIVREGLKAGLPIQPLILMPMVAMTGTKIPTMMGMAFRIWLISAHERPAVPPPMRKDVLLVKHLTPTEEGVQLSIIRMSKPTSTTPTSTIPTSTTRISTIPTVTRHSRIKPLRTIHTTMKPSKIRPSRTTRI